MVGVVVVQHSWHRRLIDTASSSVQLCTVSGYLLSLSTVSPGQPLSASLLWLFQPPIHCSSTVSPPTPTLYQTCHTHPPAPRGSTSQGAPPRYTSWATLWCSGATWRPCWRTCVPAPTPPTSPSVASVSPTWVMVCVCTALVGLPVLCVF